MDLRGAAGPLLASARKQARLIVEATELEAKVKSVLVRVLIRQQRLRRKRRGR